MANDNNPVETDLPRARDEAAGEKKTGVLARLDGSRWFRPALVVVSAVAVGIVLAPQWATRNYPTDPELIGTPAPNDIKAEYDDRGDIIDEKTTGRLKDEAVAKTKRIYDFDAELGNRTAERVRSAFAAARREIDTFIASKPAYASPATLSRSAAAAFASGLDQAMARAREAFIDELAEPVTPEDIEALAAARYSAETGDLLSDLLIYAQKQPVIQNRGALSDDTVAGIVVRQLSGDTKWIVEDVASIVDVDSLRVGLGGALDEVLAARHETSVPKGVPKAESLAAHPSQETPTSPAHSAAMRTVILRLAAGLVHPTLTFNRRDTEMARSDAKWSVAPVTIAVKRGQMIIRDGEVFTERHLLVLRQMARYSHDSSILMVTLGAGLMVIMLILAGFAFGGRWRGEFNVRDALFLASLFFCSVALARLWLAVGVGFEERWPTYGQSAVFYLLPVAAGAIIARLVLRVEIAVVFAVVVSLVFGLVADGERLAAVYALVGSVLGATSIKTISRRSDLLRVGVGVGAAQAVTAIGMQLFAAEGGVSVYLVSATTAFVSGLLAAFVALAVTPVVEAGFRYTTDLKLLELANLNHAALKELIVQAPGTYHHSIIVGSLVEAAAEAIGANVLLAKVMAYYHDLGKGCNAMYFIENQRGGVNPHDKLKPSMSAIIIRRHVSDGLDLAERYGLGEEIISGIAEHHGTTLIQYFYARAVEDAADDTVISENDYRYPGRKPQSRETALVMLGDSVEAASRSLADPTAARLQGLVNKIINVKFTDGQLEDCDLTLKDLHTIAKAFMQVLVSIYHRSRVEYPEAHVIKRGHEDPDSKPSRQKNGSDEPPREDRPDNIRRLGLSGR